MHVFLHKIHESPRYLKKLYIVASVNTIFYFISLFQNLVDSKASLAKMMPKTNSKTNSKASDFHNFPNRRLQMPTNCPKLIVKTTTIVKTINQNHYLGSPEINSRLNLYIRALVDYC